jgi:hypothetical protein
MAATSLEPPSIHVSVVGAGAPELYHWVEIGAEEEGVPTQLVAPGEADLVSVAYAAAQSSRFDIGVAIGVDQIVLHESHMPPLRPVLTLTLGLDAARVSRRAGANAARMVARLPLRFGEESEEQPPARGHRAVQHAVEASTCASIGEARSPADQVPGDRSAPRTSGDDGAKLLARLIASVIRQRGVE